ncbi:MAG: hypothetical protein DRO94_03920 [Candidatus Altiarchaeales archaeon]|nr:MAG: hypothetical protein DRO94_03920 [Candidatus Altiarchaeales archaeon]
MMINSSFLVGERLEMLEEGHIIIENGRIVEICDGYEVGAIDMKDYIVIPGLINAHTHVGDSFAKEAVLGMNVKRAVGERGEKWRLYSKTDKKTIISGIKNSIEYMLNSGITTFVDFREYGKNGVDLLRNLLVEFPIKSLILGRDIDIDECDGLGLNLYQLDQIPDDRKGKIIAIHAGEKNGEVEIALRYDPDVIIHFVHYTESDLATTLRKDISVVICPRSNSVLRVGLPNVREILDYGINVALGTDNVMINSPDLFREMEFVSKISYLSREILPVEVLQMTTVNAAKAFKLNSGVIERKRNADLIFIDKNAPNLKYNRNIIATIVHRCNPENVRKVMINGKFVLDKDMKK